MPTETVTVQYVNPPKEAGKSYGSIKTQDGKFISVHKDKLNLFQKGGSYVVEYETTQQGYHNFKGLVGGQTALPTAAAAPRQDDMATAERIFVCGVVNQSVAAGHSTAWPDLVTLINNARNAFAFTFGGRKPPQQQVQTAPPAREEPPVQEDSIPF